MTWLDTSITIGVLIFIVLIAWSKIQNQTMKETVFEIRDILMGLNPKEVVKK